MPPKKRPLTPLRFAVSNGKLTELGRGIAYGLHLCDRSDREISQLMLMSYNGVKKLIQQVERSITLVEKHGEYTGY